MSRTVVLGWGDDRKWQELPKRFKIERPRCRKRIEEFINRGYSLLEIARLNIPKEDKKIMCSDGLIVQARKMIFEEEK